MSYSINNNYDKAWEDKWLLSSDKGQGKNKHLYYHLL